jgi:hypothetical protein
MDKVEREELRAYPMLAQPGQWSIRLEGLEVARLDAAGGLIDVGKVGKDNAVSPARGVWLQASEPGAAREVRADDPGTIAVAARQITRFAAAWLNPGGTQQNEHALESRSATWSDTSTGEASSRPYGGPAARPATLTPCSTKGGHHGQSR